MNGQDLNEVIKLVAGSSSALRGNVREGRLEPVGGGRFRFEAPAGSLDDAAYDLFRPTPYLLNCANSAGDVEVGFITRKQVIQSPPGICCHATVAAVVPGIQSSGLLIGRNAPGATARAGLYHDSEQYIHASLTADQASEFWYYGRLRNDQAGAVLEIDLSAAGVELFADPRSDDGIIGATRIDPRHITRVTPLPSVADMRAFLQGQGWSCVENAVTMRVNGLCKGVPASTTAYSLSGAWRKFYLGVKNGTLP